MPGPAWFCFLIAVVLFVLEAVGVQVGVVSFLAAGLAFLAAGHLFGQWRP